MAGRERVDKQLVERLKTVPLFSGCSTRELASLSQFLKVVDFPAGRAIVKEGNTGAGLHVLLEGKTKVVVGPRTRQRLGPGDFFGEISLLDRGPRMATVVAETPPVVVVLELPGRAQGAPQHRAQDVGGAGPPGPHHERVAQRLTGGRCEG
jgi:CRP/FNR family cyclic AMP-dependent transcriptional regulator